MEGRKVLVGLAVGVPILVGTVLLSIPVDGSGGESDSVPSSRSIQLPADTVTFQAGPGSELTTRYCLICHSADYIYMQPPFGERTWNVIVSRMKEQFACPIPEEQVPHLVQYLVSQSGRKPLDIAVSAHRAQGEASTSGNPMRGKILFERHCVLCHGPRGKGDGPVGRALVPPAADLTSEDVRNNPDAELLGIIRSGKPPSAMPAWKQTLSEQEIHDVLAYVRQLVSPSPGN